MFIEYFQNKLSEIFEIGQKPQKNTPKRNKELLYEYLIQKYPKEQTETIIENVHKHFKKVLIFEVFTDERYIIFLFKTEKLTEVHFNNFNKVDFYEKTDTESVPIKILSSIFNIVYWYTLIDLESIELSHESPARLKLYLKIINKIIKKFNLSYSIIEELKKIKIEHQAKQMFEKFKNKD